MKTTQKLGHIGITLHWVLAALIIFNWIYPHSVEDLPRPERAEAMRLHFSLGILIFILALWRLSNRLIEGFPEPRTEQAKSLELLSKIVHWVLLLIVIILPISGFFAVYAYGNGVPFFGMTFAESGIRNEAMHEGAGNAHEVMAKILMIAFVLHFAGVLKHIVIDKDGTFKRMLGFKTY